MKRIKKEIIRVRRKLALQKGQKTSDMEDSADTGLINSNFKKYIWLTVRCVIFIQC